MELSKDINVGIVSGTSQEIGMHRKTSQRDHTVTTITERHNLSDGGYKTVKTTETRYHKGIFDIFIDFLS